MHLNWRRAGLPNLFLLVILCLALSLLAAGPVLAADGGPSPVRQAATPGPAGGALSPTIPTPQPLSGPIKPPDAVTGKATYQQNCAPCHGALGDGQGQAAGGLGVAPTALRDFKTISGLSLADMFSVVKNGRMQRMMPPWANVLNDQQIWDVVGYAWSLHTSAEEVATGKTLYDANCASCHGADGKGKNGAPDLTDFAKTSTRTQNDWLGIIAKGQGQMPGFGDKLKPEEQQAVAEYARSLSFTRLFRNASDLTGTALITGTVINGTTAQAVPNLALKLQIQQQDGTVLGQRQATSDATGNYRFAGLPNDATLAYILSADYPAGVLNQTDPTSFQAGQNSLALPLHVFETTKDPAGIKIDRAHFIVDFADGQLQIAELAVISHDGDKTYTGDDSKAVLRFNLPKDAQNLDIAGDPTGERFRAVKGGFIDTLPLPPGSAVRQVLFRYVIPYSGTGYDLVSSLPYPAAVVNALVNDVGAQANSPQLANQGTRQSQMGSFINLVGQNVPANQPVTIQFTNLPAPGATNAGSSAGTAEPAPAAPNSTDRWLLVGMVVLVGGAALLLAFWPVLRQRSRRAVLEAEELDRAGLVDALARLDLAHEAGELGDVAYRDQRMRLKAQLLDILRQEQA